MTCRPRKRFLGRYFIRINLKNQIAMNQKQRAERLRQSIVKLIVRRIPKLIEKMNAEDAAISKTEKNRNHE